jgi:hypothetical protein
VKLKGHMRPLDVFGLLLGLAVAANFNSANAGATQESKAEAALAGKNGPNAKIGSNPFSNVTFDTERVTIGGADLATVLDRKWSH